MSYFTGDSIEESIFTECRYIKDIRNASDVEMVKALVKVLEYYTECIDENAREAAQEQK